MLTQGCARGEGRRDGRRRSARPVKGIGSHHRSSTCTSGILTTSKTDCDAPVRVGDAYRSEVDQGSDPSWTQSDPPATGSGIALSPTNSATQIIVVLTPTTCCTNHLLNGRSGARAVGGLRNSYQIQSASEVPDRLSYPLLVLASASRRRHGNGYLNAAGNGDSLRRNCGLTG
jgi:hypothetical protein